MKVGQFILLFIFNIGLIVILYFVQKRLLEKRIRHLNHQVEELENLVSAIMEEFEGVIEAHETLDPVRVEPVSLVTDSMQESEQLTQPLADSPTNGMKTSNAMNITVASEMITSKGISISNQDNRSQIYDLWESGLTIEEIAKHMRTGQGEVQLAIKLYKRS